MPEITSRDSYSVYLDDEIIEQIDGMEDVSRSEAVRQALRDWIPSNLNGQ